MEVQTLHHREQIGRRDPPCLVEVVERGVLALVPAELLQELAREGCTAGVPAEGAQKGRVPREVLHELRRRLER